LNDDEKRDEHKDQTMMMMRTSALLAARFDLRCQT
jgi:hypothetical protein